jgi:23S rRNA (guanine2445-N2)-methyltransferase / 23S rRNA (guanine2069-N7)-methyltransferase
MANRPFFATAALGIEPLLVEELIGLGAQRVKEERAGVSFTGDLQVAYRVCLWSRLASRVLLPLARFTARDTDQLYREVSRVNWTEHLAVDGTFAVDCTSIGSPIRHTHYGALRVKDAVVDQFRSRFGVRPSISLTQPDLRLNLHLLRDQATLSLDLAGESLHRRGYRIDGVTAPMKENLAAAILTRGGWPAIAAAGGALVDPMCGSGTLPIEAALMATDTAPGLLRNYFGFFGWRQHSKELWRALCEEAVQRRRAGMENRAPSIAGFDTDQRAIKAAWAHAQKAGVDKVVHFERRTLQEFTVPKDRAMGLLVANPPYGERMGEEKELAPLYNLLGERMAAQCRGWKAAVITSHKELGRAIGLRAGKINTLYNGALKCHLLQFDLVEANQWFPLSEDGTLPQAPKQPSAAALQFADQIRLNAARYQSCAQQEGTDSYRLYDSDLPEFALAVDRYGDEVILQEYLTDPETASQSPERRLREVMDCLSEVLGIPSAGIHLKVRQQQKGLQQYEKQSRRGLFTEVQEGNCRFLVNLTDYIDTGLFLDHRPTRKMIQEMARGKRFLNLFAYTGTATVHALAGGAVQTTTVDMSRTYLDWAQRNIALNGFNPRRQELVRAECLAWIDAMQEERAGAYDLIFLDPPTFSNSKSMKGTFDVQRDHVDLLRKVSRLLAPEGQLLFSTNLRTFKLKAAALPELVFEDVSAQTIPFDFARNPGIHHCFCITQSGAPADDERGTS